MGQRQSGTGSAATARYQPYTSSLTVDGGTGADRQSPGTVRVPSSATATPDHHLRHLRPTVPTGGRVRALSLGNFPGPSSSSASGAAGGSQTASVGGAIGGVASSPDSDDDSGDDSGGGLFGALAAMSTMPPSLTLYRGLFLILCTQYSFQCQAIVDLDSNSQTINEVVKVLTDYEVLYPIYPMKQTYSIYICMMCALSLLHVCLIV